MDGHDAKIDELHRHPELPAVDHVRRPVGLAALEALLGGRRVEASMHDARLNYVEERIVPKARVDYLVEAHSFGNDGGAIARKYSWKPHRILYILKGA